MACATGMWPLWTIILFFVSFCQELPPQRNPCAVDLGKSDLELFKASMITRAFTICMLNQFDLGMVVHVDDVNCGPCK